MGEPARNLPAPSAPSPPPANDQGGVHPALRPFIEAMAELLVADLRRRPVR